MRQLTLCLMLAAAACADGNQPTGCKSNADCTPGEVCRGGTCLRVCVTNADCPDEEICDDGLCVESQASGSCSGVICHADATCVDSGDRRVCQCDSGYDGDGTAGGSGCVNIDECLHDLHDCVAGATCVDNDGGFICQCPPGFDGDGTTGGSGCSNVDECAAGTDECVPVAATCTDTDGSFTCACTSGYTGDGTTGGTGCTDIDECAGGSDDCVALATCEDIDGGFICDCDPGYDGDGRSSGTGCSDIDECTTGAHDCVPTLATCTNTPAGTFTCTCQGGYTGDGRVGGTGCTQALTGCAAGASAEVFSDNMVGCPGAVTYAARSSLCDSGWLPCTAQAWRFELSGRGAAPDHHYWTDDQVYYVLGGGPGDCVATIDASFPSVSTTCSPDQPMRVCAPIGDPGVYQGHVDASGNECNWINCGYEANTPHFYFGGCFGNTTAGTLCCQHGCADGSVEQTFSADMIGCGGTVTFANRATLCDSGWHVCTAAEWRTHINGFGVPPALHYWTDDDVYWGPQFGDGGSSNNCWATTNTSFPDAQTNCSPDRPMRVCAPVGNPDVIEPHLDELGNDCTWIQCGWESTTPNEYWGGCFSNLTASTLCCR